MPLLSLALSKMTAIAVVVVMVVVVVIVIIFRKNIQGAIDRWNVQPLPPLGNQIAPAQSETPRQQTFINVQPDNAEAQDRTAKLAQTLNNSSPTLEEKLMLALVDLANKDLRLEYEILFRSIYESQFEALRALRQEGP